MKTPYGMRITGLAAYAPPRIVTNDEIASRLRDEVDRLRTFRRSTGAPDLTDDELKKFETSDRWIRRFIGFTERRFASEREGTIDMALRAAQLLLARTHCAPRDIDGIVFGTVTPSYRHSPPDAAQLQELLGIPNDVGGRPRDLIGLDVSLACSTWTTALHLTYRLLADAERILLIGADRMSGTINWHDRGFACVLGDAGTAALCERVPSEEDWFGSNRFFGWLDGRKSMVINGPAGGSRRPDLTPEDLSTYQHRMVMDGRQVREDMVPFVGGPAIETALDKAGLTMADVDALILHEANRVLNREIVDSLRQRGFDGRVLDADGRFGNTTSASIPLAICLNGESLTVGQTVVLVGFGGGYSLRTAIATIKHPLQVFTDL